MLHGPSWLGGSNWPKPVVRYEPSEYWATERKQPIFEMSMLATESVPKYASLFKLTQLNKSNLYRLAAANVLLFITKILKGKQL